jgi:hypothetical protein
MEDFATSPKPDDLVRRTEHADDIALGRLPLPDGRNIRALKRHPDIAASEVTAA